ncbi:diadenosine tetraphosphatase family protein [Besnoitia besnoiti]|uniref:Diadenosine tetraphosphatase family protein n=1 Tax=Besnoitia besnoiti TaxID=94643 RepID=A0A2A9MG89_BESBE|nr:diadenosine tetraphosphatase family protein [Besnoitia besnoiti]PFH36184.1 diadenosine tetraphosphatase family protein [Besnoitia besnoiti]
MSLAPRLRPSSCGSRCPASPSSALLALAAAAKFPLTHSSFRRLPPPRAQTHATSACRAAALSGARPPRRGVEAASSRLCTAPLSASFSLRRSMAARVSACSPGSPAAPLSPPSAALPVPLEGVPWSSHQGADDPTETYCFAQWLIERREVFFWSPFSVAFTNLKPVVPGHVLVVPKRVVPHFRDLTGEEVKDLFESARRVAALILSKTGADCYSIALQDGAASGQTVAHVHLHILPRFKGDFEPVRAGVDREDSKPRTREEMAAEAQELRDWVRRLSAVESELTPR